MERVENCVSFLVGKAAQQITRRTRDLLAPFGVTPVQYAALSLLWERDGQSGAELGTRLVLDSATVTGMIDRLAAAGLVERRADPGGDRRVHRVVLTAKGSGLQQPLSAAMAKLNQQVADELGGRASAFFKGLRQLGLVAEPPPQSR